MSTEEKNILIAEFDGKIKDRSSPWWRGFDLMVHGMISCHQQTLKYHSSWDWLMPVVKKISDSGKLYSYKIYSGHTTISNGEGAIFQIVNDNPLIATYEAVVQFIQWYNQNK